MSCPPIELPVRIKEVSENVNNNYKSILWDSLLNHFFFFFFILSSIASQNNPKPNPTQHIQDHHFLLLLLLNAPSNDASAAPEGRQLPHLHVQYGQ